MKKILIIPLFPFFSYSQSIYVCEYKYQADLLVYKVEYKYLADIVVDNNIRNKYYFTPYRLNADLKVYFVKEKYLAEKTLFVKN